MKIFGIGLNKTGTLTLTSALEVLGYKISHWTHHIEIANSLLENNINFSLLNEYDGITDLPIPAIYKKLDVAYPRSKFILTLRDKEKWIKSAERHYARSTKNWPHFETYLTYGTWVFDKALFLKKYDEHYQDVMTYFKDRPEDLLVLNFETGDGWNELSSFFGKETPKIPFPHLNNSLKNKKKTVLLDVDVLRLTPKFDLKDFSGYEVVKYLEDRLDENLKLKLKNEKLAKDLDEMKNSLSWKLTSVFRFLFSKK